MLDAISALCQPVGCRRNGRRNRKIVMDVSWSFTRAERSVPSWLSMRVRWPGWDCERRDDPPPLSAHVGKLFFLCRRHAAAAEPRSRQRCSGLSASADPGSVRCRRCPFRPWQSPPARTSAGPPSWPFLPGESGLRRAVQPFLTLVRAIRRHGRSSAPMPQGTSIQRREPEMTTRTRESLSTRLAA